MANGKKYLRGAEPEAVDVADQGAEAARGGTEDVAWDVAAESEQTPATGGA